MKARSQPKVYDDVWVRSQCGMCYGACAIRVHRVNGVAVKIEGEPDSTMGSGGGVCGKGAAGLQLLYDPNRLNVPLRRTNPEKGLHVDPKWKEITWDEALDEIVSRLKKIIDDDPRKVRVQFTTIRSRSVEFYTFTETLGIPKHNKFLGGSGVHCGSGAHQVAGQVFASWSIVPDFKYCDYAIFVGASKGTAAGHSPMITAKLRAESITRGMKTVAFDPICHFAGGKAAEWVPILPGTDGAVLLAMSNIIVNELKIWDAVYLKTKTNAPYLIGPDLRYVRDKETGKPLVWDNTKKKAVPYDYKSIPDYATARTIDYALEGEYKVNGILCHPAFHLVRENLKQWTPERASEISTVPANTIRRIATEYAQAAKVGSTIVIDGVELPLRPVSVVMFFGGQGHENSYHTCFAVTLLNQIVGNPYAVGGTQGWPAVIAGFGESKKLKRSPYMGVDGFMEYDYWGSVGGIRKLHGPWPKKLPKIDKGDLSLISLFPCGQQADIFGQRDQEEMWQKVGIPFRLEMLLNCGCNSVLNTANHKTAEAVLKRIPFIVSFELFANELVEGFSDIVLPDACFLEHFSWGDGFVFNYGQSWGMDDFAVHVMHKVVEPKGERRYKEEVLYEILRRMGYEEELKEVLNSTYNLEGDLRFKPEDKVTWSEVSDRVLQSLLGPGYNQEWFKKNGFVRWSKKPEEAYWTYFVDARVPMYMEYLLDMKEKLEEINKQTGLGINLEQYHPFISWFPCSIHKETNPEFDLYCFSYRDVLHSGSMTMEQPWLDEASKLSPYTYNFTMNRDTAKKRGLQDGDTIEIESAASGNKVQGTLKLMEGQHPQTISISACSGHWAKGLPIAKDKGANFDTLLELDMKHMDHVSLSIETAVRVKVRKVEKTNKKGSS